MSHFKQKILFVTGKGGVGKSTLAASAALSLTRRGLKVLLVELNDYGHFSHLLSKPIGYLPTKWRDNLAVACWDGEACLREYLKHYVRIEAIVDLFFNNTVMKTFMRAAPALKEISILGKATSGIRGVGPTFDYDYVVIDSYATGHFQALLRASRGLAEAIPFGPMGEQSRQIEAILKDPQFCQYLVVTLPEPLPVSECQELSSHLYQEWKIKAQIICNKIWDIPGSQEELVAMRQSLQQIDSSGAGFVHYLEVIQKRQELAVSKMKEFSASFEALPFLFRKNGVELIEDLSERLSNSDFSF